MQGLRSGPTVRRLFLRKMGDSLDNLTVTRAVSRDIAPLGRHDLLDETDGRQPVAISSMRSSGSGIKGALVDVSHMKSTDLRRRACNMRGSQGAVGVLAARRTDPSSRFLGKRGTIPLRADVGGGAPDEGVA